MKVRVGGAAIPGGVMMLHGNRAGVAILDDIGMVRSASFETVKNPVKIPVLRGVTSLGCSLVTMAKATGKVIGLKHSAGESVLPGILTAAGTLLAAGGVMAGYSFLWERLAENMNPKTAGILSGGCDLLVTAALLGVLAMSPAGKKIRAFHGAEHKTVHCTDLGLAPIPENAKGQSRIHPRCGTSLAVGALSAYALAEGLVLPFLPENLRDGAGLLMLCGAIGVAYEALMRGDKGFVAKVGGIVQRVTTAEPTEAQLEAASAAVYACLYPDGRE
ncbi:MAG: DUF1385 domain-containing protein [Clostridia bacterium]|nr:DUF1385 domain-containing protein [Clostridia bacterium]